MRLSMMEISRKSVMISRWVDAVIAEEYAGVKVCFADCRDTGI